MSFILSYRGPVYFKTRLCEKYLKFAAGVRSFNEFILFLGYSSLLPSHSCIQNFCISDAVCYQASEYGPSLLEVRR
jgi:hypothetical protein